MADKIVVFKDEGNVWRWKKLAANQERVATSGESFDSRGNAIRAAWREVGSSDATVEIEEPSEPDAAA